MNSFVDNIVVLLTIFIQASKCNVCTICRQIQLSTRWHVNLLNVNLNYMFRPQSFLSYNLMMAKFCGRNT